MNVDVVVTDKKGAPLTDLRRDEFIVLEDGRPQQVVDLRRGGRAGAPRRRPRPSRGSSSNTAPELQTGRTFVVVFDDIHLTPFQAQRAKGAVAEFLKTGVREGDRVTLVATGGGAWWSDAHGAGPRRAAGDAEAPRRALHPRHARPSA